MFGGLVMQPVNNQGFGPQKSGQQPPPGLSMPPLMPIPNTRRQILCKCGCPYFIPYPVLQLQYAKTNDLNIPNILMPMPLEEPEMIPIPPNAAFKKTTEIFKCLKCGMLLIIDNTVQKVIYTDEEEFKERLMKHWEQQRNEEVKNDNSDKTEK